MKRVKIYTDGTCSGNPGPGGWACLLKYGENEKLLSGSDEKTTNNQMELAAVIEGITALKERCHITIYSDSQYVTNAFNKGWLKNWQENGWRTKDRKPVKNKELWMILSELINNHEVEFVHVLGHNGDPDNERVDKEARSQIKR